MKRFLVLLFIIILSLPSYSEEAVFYEQIYLSEKEAINTVFEDLKVTEKIFEPNEQQKKIIQKKLRRKIKEDSFKIYIGKKENKVEKYAIITEEIGKHYPITFIVGVKPNLSIDQIAVMVYREKRGDAIKRKRFLNQFSNKSLNDPLEVNTDIVHLTGSTISSWSVASGSKKILVILEEFLKSEKSI